MCRPMFSACSLDRPRRRSRSSVDSMLHSMPFGIFGSPGRRCVYGFCDGKLIVPSELRRGFDRYSPRFASRYSIFSSRVNSRRSSPSGRWSRSLWKSRRWLSRRKSLRSPSRRSSRRKLRRSPSRRSPRRSSRRKSLRSPSLWKLRPPRRSPSSRRKSRRSPS